MYVTRTCASPFPKGVAIVGDRLKVHDSASRKTFGAGELVTVPWPELLNIPASSPYFPILLDSYRLILGYSKKRPLRM